MFGIFRLYALSRHIELLKTAKNKAAHLNAKVGLFTFRNNHLRILGRDVSVMYTFEERLEIYDSVGIDYIVCAEFDDNFRKTSGKDFLNKLKRLNLKGIVCGFDHHCGSDRLDCFGIREFLSDVCPVDIVEQISVQNEKVSTTLARRLLSGNDVSIVNSLLSEPFFIIGTVCHGRGVGKTLGFPTANIQVGEDKYLPIGVYGGVAKIYGVDGEYKCIVNIGQTPTFGLVQTTVEAHLLGYDGNLYGKRIKLSLIKYLRAITKFNSPSELSAQLKKDKESVLND